MMPHSLWLQKLVLLDLYRRLIRDLPFEKMLIRSYLLVFFASYVAAQVTTFSECSPVRLYWQIFPDPGMSIMMGNAPPRSPALAQLVKDG